MLGQPFLVLRLRQGSRLGRATRGPGSKKRGFQGAEGVPGAAQRWRCGMHAEEAGVMQPPHGGEEDAASRRFGSSSWDQGGGSSYSPTPSSCDVFLTLIRDPSPWEPTIMINGVKYSQRLPGPN